MQQVDRLQPKSIYSRAQRIQKARKMCLTTTDIMYVAPTRKMVHDEQYRFVCVYVYENEPEVMYSRRKGNKKNVLSFGMISIKQEQETQTNTSFNVVYFGTDTIK